MVVMNNTWALKLTKLSKMQSWNESQNIIKTKAWARWKKMGWRDKRVKNKMVIYQRQSTKKGAKFDQKKRKWNNKQNFEK